MTPGFRRLVAAFAVAAIGWTALWPVVASVRDTVSGVAEPLCHQAGMQVAPGETPEPASPGGERKTHCPLCIFALYVAHASSPVAPAFQFHAYLLARAPEGIATLFRFFVGLPQSRAPPSV